MQYWASNFSEAAVRQETERQRDVIINLKQLIHQLKYDSGVKIAEHFSDFMGPTSRRSVSADNLFGQRMSGDMLQVEWYCLYF